MQISKKINMYRRSAKKNLILFALTIVLKNDTSKLLIPITQIKLNDVVATHDVIIIPANINKKMKDHKESVYVNECNNKIKAYEYL